MEKVLDMMKVQFLEKGFLGRIKGILSSIPIGLIMSAKHGSLLKKGLDVLFPSPGEGPTKQKMEKGFYKLRFYITLAGWVKCFCKGHWRYGSRIWI